VDAALEDVEWKIQDAIYALVRRYGLTLPEAQALLTQASMSQYFRISIKYDGTYWIQYVRISSGRGVTPEQIGEVYRSLKDRPVWRSARSIAAEMRVQPIHIGEALKILHAFDLVDKKLVSPGVPLWFATLGAEHARI
jgi:hypothetical protein